MMQIVMLSNLYEYMARYKQLNNFKNVMSEEAFNNQRNMLWRLIELGMDEINIITQNNQWTEECCDLRELVNERFCTLLHEKKFAVNVSDE